MEFWARIFSHLFSLSHKLTVSNIATLSYEPMCPLYWPDLFCHDSKTTSLTFHSNHSELIIYKLHYTATLVFQDTFLPHVENGTITLIGATTENPSFQLNNALLSRCRVIVLEKLTVDHVEQILRNALNTMGVLVGKGDSLDKKQRNLVPKERYIKNYATFLLT